MATLFLKSTDAGAPTLNGVNGSLCNVLNWALVQNGWAVEYTATNARVYRPCVGNRRRLAVRHDSAVSGAANKATVRGCENASSATAYTDPFPTVGQMANSAAVWATSDTADATARGYRIVVGTTFFILMIRLTDWPTSADPGYATYFFGDVPSTFSGDVWNTLIWINNTSGASLGDQPLLNPVYGYPAASSSTHFWCRTIDGTVKSSRGSLSVTGAGGSYLGCVGSGEFPSAREGYGGVIQMERLYVSDTGVPGTGASNKAKMALRRALIPNVWAPLHNGRGVITPTECDDTFTNTAYSAAASFRVIIATAGSPASYPWFCLEETDTWSPP